MFFYRHIFQTEKCLLYLTANGSSNHPLPYTVASFEMFTSMLMMTLLIIRIHYLTYQSTKKISYSITVSYRRAVAPRSPGCCDTVVGASQKAHLGSGWHFLLITQAVLHTAGLPTCCSFLHTPSRTADAAV